MGDFTADRFHRTFPDLRPIGKTDLPMGDQLRFPIFAPRVIPSNGLEDL
jgi:hypothetical protein